MLDEGDSEDVFIGADDTCGAFDGDHVEIVLTKNRKEEAVKERS